MVGSAVVWDENTEDDYQLASGRSEKLQPLVSVRLLRGSISIWRPAAWTGDEVQAVTSSRASHKLTDLT